MSRSGKLLVICQHFWPESFRINDACDYFVEQGCDVDVLCGIPNYPKGEFFAGYSNFRNKRQEHNGVHIYRTFEIARGNNSNLRIFLNYISFPIASLFHIPRLLTRKYDKIFIYQLSPVLMAISGIIVGKLKKTETVMYVLDLWPENLYSVLPIQNRLLRRLAEGVSHWHYRHVDKIVVLSEKMKTRLQDVTHISEDKIVVLPQACEKIYEAEVHDVQLAKRFAKGFNILFTGNISPAQSFETVIDAAKQLQKDGVKDINWIIVGDGMSRKWLEDEVAGTDLADHFFFEGFKPVEDIPTYTNIADILLGCLIKSDLLEATIPAKVMSYIAAGRPIALAMDGEVQTLINDTIRCGYAGPAGDAQALVANIKKLHSLSDKERAALGERARRYHFKHFERNIVLNRLYNFIFA
jgi:glycosyltransferase involved in cell wall biosynthesis